MNRILRILTVALILSILVVPLLAISVYAISLERETIDSGGDSASSPIYGLNVTAQIFESSATAHTVTKIKLPLQRVLAPTLVTVSLCEVLSVAPAIVLSDVLASDTFDGADLPVAYEWITFDMTTSTGGVYALSNSTDYAIVVSVAGGVADYVEWWQDAGGDGVATSYAIHSTDGGSSTWTSDTPTDCLFEVWGEDVLGIRSVNVFQSYLETGDLLFALEVYNTYPPYFDDNNDPRQYFQVQLLGLDYVTVLASTPLNSWGYSPQSLYLSASSASSITVGDAYRLRIIGTFTGTPSVIYDLTLTDWRGTNLSNLDTWVIGTAQHIQSYYGYTGGDVLWEEITGSGKTLTDKGGGIFVKGIQGLVTVRPDLFTITQDQPNFIAGTPNNTYDTSGGDYRAWLGDEVADDLDSWGTLFNTSGNVFGGWLLAFGMAIITLVGTVMGGGRGGIAVLVIAGLPLIFIGMYTHLIGMQWVLLGGSLVMILMFIRQFWWKST